MNDLLQELARPFEPKHITWKPGAATKDGGKCMAMAYADLRAYQERLDEVCGLEWCIEYLPWGDTRVIARLTINGVTRSSTGEMGSQDVKNEMGGTVAEAQAMKRAAAQFGLGRYLYDLPSAWVEFDAQRKRITDAGQKELDNRYVAWYNKTISAQSAQKQTPRKVDTETGEIVDVTSVSGSAGVPPTEEELTAISRWQNRTEAEQWAVYVQACKNEHEARKSLDKSIAKFGGKVTGENYRLVYVDFLRHQYEKLEAPVAA